MKKSANWWLALPKNKPRKLFWVMKLPFLMCVFFATSVSAEVWSQQRLTMRLGETGLKEVFKEIQRQTNKAVVYNDDQLTLSKKVKANFTDVELEEILKQVLQGQGMSYKFMDDYIILVKQPATPQHVEEVTVKGKVTDKEGMPLPGVTIVLKGTTIGTASDVDGNFSLNIPKAGMVLQFSYVGMKNKELTVQGNGEFNIVMEYDQSDLDEVVVIGYGTATKKDLTGAVARFDSKIIEESTATNIAHMMQGQVAGLSILNVDGSPGSAARLEIRGVPSLTGALAPLIVVDNVPMPSDFDINELNPDDVQSIDILKGASSAAIYGSRGAAGVIMITMKAGQRNQKPIINYSYDYSATRLVSDVNTLNADEYKMLFLEAITNSAKADGFEDVNLYPMYQKVTAPGYFGEEDTPWMKHIMRNGSTQQHRLSIRGGSQDFGYYASFGYANEEGMVKATDFQRYTYTLGFDADINKWIKANAKFSGTTSDRHVNGASLSTAAAARPDIPAYNEDGSLYLHPYISGGKVYYVKNPIIEMTENTTTYSQDNFRLTGNLEFQILPELKLLTQYTYQRRKGEESSYASSNTQEGSGYWGDQKGVGRWAYSAGQTMEFEGRLTYNKTFNEKHSLNALGAIVYNKDRQNNTYFKLRDFPDDEVQNGIWQGSDLVDYGGKGGSAVGSVMFSYIARAEYKFMNRYLLTGTFRADGSSRFAPKYRWGKFPSVAAAWIVSEEDFLRESNIFTFLKLRGGWGKTGNAYVGEYGWRTLYENADYENQPATRPSQIGNDRLKWEATEQVDLALDFGFLPNQRISGTLGFYKKKTDGLLYAYTMALSTGLETTQINFANIENKGIEFEIKANIIDNKDWNWFVGFNIGKNKNKITDIDAEYVSYPGSSYLGNTVIQEGKSLGLIYGYKTDGIFQTQEEVNRYEALNPDQPYQEAYGRKTMPGDLKYVDLSGDGYVNKVSGSTEDKTVIGCSRPDFEGGFATRLSWKGLKLSVQGTFSHGAQKIWMGEANMFNMAENQNTQSTALKRWTPENPSNKYPSIRYNFYYNDFGDNAVYDASYVKIQNINLEYSLPRHWVDKTRIFGNVSIFASANNVYTFTSYPGPSPESFSTDAIEGASVDNDMYPTTRTFNFGVKVTIK